MYNWNPALHTKTEISMKFYKSILPRHVFFVQINAHVGNVRLRKILLESLMAAGTRRHVYLFHFVVDSLLSLLSPKLKEVARICVKLQSVFSIVPRADNNDISIHLSKKITFLLMTDGLHLLTCRDWACWGVVVGHKQGRLLTWPLAWSRAKPLVGRKLGMTGTLCVVGCLEVKLEGEQEIRCA